MKKVSLKIVLVLLFFVIVIPLKAQIRGNGEITKQLYDVDNFDAVKVDGARTLVLTQGDNFSVEVETDSNIQDYVTIEVKNNTLYFGFNTKKIKKYEVLKFYVTAPNYKQIKASGASVIKSNGTLSGDNLLIAASGASDLNLEVDYKNIITKVSGASDVTLSGSTSSSIVDCSGASEFHGKNLTTTSSVINASGASTCYVNSNAHLTYEVSGASEVKYVSTPQTVVIKKNHGPEKIIVRNDTARVSKYYNDTDTTKVNVGSLNIEVIDGDTTMITVGRHTLCVTDNGDVTWERSKRKKFNGNWGGVDIGLNGYLTPDFDMSFDKADDYLSLQMEKSINLNLNIYEQNISLNKDKNIGLITGLGITFNNYRFNNQTYLTSDSSFIAGYYMSGINVRKTKLTAMYLTVPLFFEVQTKTSNRLRQFHFAAGGLISARVSTHTKIYFNESNKEFDLLVDPSDTDTKVAKGESPSSDVRNIVKNFNSFHLAPFKFDVSVRFGYGIINLYATYSLNTMFQKDRGPELYPFTAGITLVGW